MTELSTAGLLSWVRRQISSRSPAAIVRFGDGEERLLAADRSQPDTMDQARRQIEQQSGMTFQAEEILAVRAAVRQAWDEADVLGILPHEPGYQRPKAPLSRLKDLQSESAAAATANCHLNHRILAELPGLLAGRQISVISCRDVAPVIEARWDVTDVAVYPVPSQHLVRDVDGPYEASMYGMPIWPDAHDEIRSGLEVREPAEVFLVGAGVFGKDLCIHVREQGGIALDMGSALDHVAGKLTRLVPRQIPALIAAGMSAHDITAYFEDRFNLPGDHRQISELIETIDHYEAH